MHRWSASCRGSLHDLRLCGALVKLEELKERNVPTLWCWLQVWDPEKIVIIPDHYIFTADARANRNVDILRCGVIPPSTPMPLASAHQVELLMGNLEPEGG